MGFKSPLGHSVKHRGSGTGYAHACTTVHYHEVMTTEPALRRRRYARHGPIDKTAEKHFVYWLYDASGACLYIGRSCNVRARLKAHYLYTGTGWFPQVRRLHMIGPFTWDQAIAEEAAAIRNAQPPHNIVHTKRWGRAEG